MFHDKFTAMMFPLWWHLLRSEQGCSLGTITQIKMADPPEIPLHEGRFSWKFSPNLITWKLPVNGLVQGCGHSNVLTHWGQVTHIFIGNLPIIGSDNGLLPDRRQAIIWTNAGILLIGALGTNFREILIKVITFSFKKIRPEVSSGKRRPSCLGLNVFTIEWLKSCPGPRQYSSSLNELTHWPHGQNGG